MLIVSAKPCQVLAKLLQPFGQTVIKPLFCQFGISFNTFKNDVPAIIEMCQKNEEGKIYLTKQVRVLDENKQPIKNADGRTYKKVSADVAVTVWTPNTLYKVLEQSVNK